MIVKKQPKMSSTITFDLTEKNYCKLIKFLQNNDGKKLIKILESSRDDDYIPKENKKIDRYEYNSGSAEEEEIYQVETDSIGRLSLK